MTKLKKPWSKECCEQCGTEGIAARTMAVPIDDIYVCSECKAYEKGYQAGLKRQQGEVNKTTMISYNNASNLNNSLIYKDDCNYLYWHVPVKLGTLVYVPELNAPRKIIRFNRDGVHFMLHNAIKWFSIKDVRSVYLPGQDEKECGLEIRRSHGNLSLREMLELKVE